MKAGLTQNEIAAAIGITQPTLSKHFRAQLEPKRAPAPEFKPTAQLRRRVSIAAGGGMTHREISIALGISRTVLVRHFRTELTTGALERRAEVLQAMHAAAKKGNVSAQRAYLSTVLSMDQPESKPAKSRPARGPAKGKKEQAAEDASKPTGTDWDDLLPPSGAVIQ